MAGAEPMQPDVQALTDGQLDPLFWHPARCGVDSAWYGHVPFAHWIVSAHRPASLVELGAHNGVSYLAFCEAVLRCNTGTRALAVDTWRGDDHAGFYGEAVYAELRAIHDQRYAAFSTLLRTSFDDALQFVPDGSVDLLHIDGRHGYDDVAHDFAAWRPKLSSRAVVLFHDTNEHDRNFGVWRLWSELRAAYPKHFEFVHGHGLGVLALGPSVDGAVEALCTLQRGDSINRVRERFAVLGDRWTIEYDLLQQRRAGADLQTEMLRLNRDLDATKSWAESAQKEVNRLFPQHQHLMERHRQLRGDLAQARFDLATRDLQLADLTEQLAARDAALAASAERIAHLEVQRAGLADSAASQIALRDGALHAASQQIAAFEQQRDAVFASTSWRLTAPLRAVMRLKSGLPAPARLPFAPARGAETPLQVTFDSGQVENGVHPLQEDDAPTPPATIEPAGETGRRRALFISGEDDTPGHFYRIERYVEAARRAGFDAVWMRAEPVGPAELAGVTLVVLWRIAYSRHIQGIIDFTHEQGGRVIFDVDDLMFRPELAIIDIIDGIRSQKFSETETGALFRKIAQSLRACDLVTCPTAELASEARQLGQPVWVLPNGFDVATLAVSRASRRAWMDNPDDLLRIGYAGGSRTHQRDFAVAAPAVFRILRDLPQARLTLFRDPSSGEGVVLMHEFPEYADLFDRIEWRDMVPLSDLPREMARFTVNIAPLQPDNVFCEAKSELKFFEAALAGVPTVASPTGPYRRAIAHGRTGFIAQTEQDWYDAIRVLLEDAKRRERMAQDAYHVSLARFGPEARAENFALMAAQLFGGAPGAAAFERERYRITLPPSDPPTVPESDIVFSLDRRGEAEVTVIVPVFNYADYVVEALASVVAQTLEQIDLVVIDDCSPDDSTSMVLQWARLHGPRFNRVTVLRHTANAGLGHARNSGFAAADTAFVLPLDADNRLRPRACETLLTTLCEADAAFAYPAIQQFGDVTDVVGTLAYSTLQLKFGNYIDAMALVRKSAWALAGGYDHVRFGWEDYDFWCRLAERGQYGVSVPETLADYRVHDKSMLRTSTDIPDHRIELSKNMMSRHPWLDLMM